MMMGVDWGINFKNLNLFWYMRSKCNWPFWIDYGQYIQPFWFLFHPFTSILSSHLFSNVCIHNNPEASGIIFGVSFGHERVIKCVRRESIFVMLTCHVQRLFCLNFWNGYRFQLPILRYKCDRHMQCYVCWYCKFLQ